MIKSPISTFRSLFGAALVLSAMAQAAFARPNILWLIGEDLGPELSSYGTPAVKTPHIDALAAEGVRYTHAFTVAPVCSSSRSALMTGMYAQSIDAQHHRSHRDDDYRLPHGVRLLTDYFREAGYFTANVVEFARPGDDGHFYCGTGKTDWNFSTHGSASFDSHRWEDLKTHQPFFAQVNFSETHRGESWDHAHEHIENPADPAEVEIPPYYPDHPMVREDWAQYLNSVMVLDKKIGYVVNRLKQDGLWENTIVMFFGDNGQAMVRGKQWPYDSGLHIPLIVRWPAALSPPKQVRPGLVDDRLISAIDVSATSLWMAGINPPLLMQGRVILGPDSDRNARTYVFAGRDRGDETIDRIRTVRDKRFRYLRNYYPERPLLQWNGYKEASYPTLALMRVLYERGKLTGAPARLFAPTRPAEELYDLQADPHEVHNLAESPEFKPELERLRGALDAWIESINDQGRLAEDPRLAQQKAAERLQDVNYHRALKANRELALRRADEFNPATSGK